MKLIFILLIALISNVSSAQYHIMLECQNETHCYGSPSYHIVFTNDNWKSSERLLEFVSYKDYLTNDSVFQCADMWSNDEDGLIKKARALKTYKDAIMYNLQQSRLRGIYERNYLTRQKCCANQQIY